MLRLTQLTGFGVPIDEEDGGGDGPSWTDTFSLSMSSEGSGYDGITLRQVYDASLLSDSGTMVRLQLKSGTFNGCIIDGLYIGEQAPTGDAYDMVSPSQFLISGSGSFTIPGGTPTYTDALTFTFDETKTYVISVHFSGTPDYLGFQGSTSVAGFYKSASEAGTADVSGYTPRPSGQAFLVSKIQVA